MNVEYIDVQSNGLQITNKNQIKKQTLNGITNSVGIMHLRQKKFLVIFVSTWERESQLPCALKLTFLAIAQPSMCTLANIFVGSGRVSAMPVLFSSFSLSLGTVMPFGPSTVPVPSDLVVCMAVTRLRREVCTGGQPTADSNWMAPAPLLLQILLG